MRILFYDSVKNKRLYTAYVHVFEVLNELSKMGHFIIYANGDSHSQNHIKGISFHSSANQQRTLWVRIKNFVGTSPGGGEVAILWFFLIEIKFFFSALKSSLLRKPDVIYRRHSLFNSDYFLAKLLRIPSIKEVNGIIVDETRITNRGDKFSLRVINIIERFNMPRADKIIVVTSKLNEVLHNDYKVPENKIIVIPNGANTDLFKPMAAKAAREKLKLNQNDNYICFVGSLVQWQGVEYLIKSMPLILEQCPNTLVLIVGDGSMKEELTELTKQIGVSDKFVFTGSVPYEDVSLYINAGDVCVAPFVRKRNERIGVSPLKLCEYMACGKPVVASNISGIGHLLRTVRAGIVVEPESPQVLAQAITELLQDGDLRKQMGKNGRKYVVQNQSWESVARRVAEVLDQTVEAYNKKSKKN